MSAEGVSFSVDVGVQAAGADSAATSLDKLTDKISDAGSAAPEVADAIKSVGDASSEMGEKAEGASVNMQGLSSASSRLAGVFGGTGAHAIGLADGLSKLSKSLGAAGPYAAAAVVVIALATSFALATAAVFKFAVVSADAARTQSLLVAGIAGSVQGGKDLEASLAYVGDKVPLAREELMSMASDLAKTGLQGKALTDALEDTATKAAKLKFGPEFSKQMLSLDFQSAKLKRGIAGIFSGLKIDGLLESLSQLVKLFDANEASGKAIKVVFESLFQPLVDGATSMVPKVIGAILQLEIWFMKAAIFVKPFTSKIIFLAEVVGGIMVAAFVLLGAAVLFAFLPFIIAIAVSVALVAALVWLGGAAVDAGKWLIKGIGEGFDFVVAKVTGALDFLESLSLVQMGSDLIAGLIQGITGGAGAVVGALKNLVGGAVDSVKGMLGIHSPSTVFAAIGGHTADGMAMGIDDGAGKVQGSLESMVSPPVAKPVEGAAPASKGAGGGGNFSGAVFNFYGVQGAEDAQARFLEMLEGASTQGGSMVPA